MTKPRGNHTSPARKARRAAANKAAIAAYRVEADRLYEEALLASFQDEDTHDDLRLDRDDDELLKAAREIGLDRPLTNDEILGQ